MTPPTMSDLLSDERYARYIAKPPNLPPSLQWGNPFAVFGLKHTGAWARALRPGYPEAFSTFTALLDDERFADVVIVSRRRIVKEPHWHKVPGFDWCGRCRRPTLYQVNDTHHALRDAPVILEGVARCYYCGISKDMGCTPRAVRVKKESEPPAKRRKR